MAAFEITLEEGWKTYWRSPGDAGIPPRFDWASSHNLDGVALHWPRPEVFESFGTQTIGYSEKLILPVELVPVDQHRRMVVTGTVELGVCSDVCLPLSLNFQLDVPETGGENHSIRTALIGVPKVLPGSEIGSLRCHVDPIDDGMKLTATLTAPMYSDVMAAVFEYRDTAVWISGAQITFSDHELTIKSDFVPPEAQPFSLDRSEVALNLLGRDAALEISGCPAG